MDLFYTDRIYQDESLPIGINMHNCSMVHIVPFANPNDTLHPLRVAERANGRDHPVLLTKQGATWIRKVCGGDAVDDVNAHSRRFVVP